jgi:expansin (peptidoglycan-binding protein)
MEKLLVVITREWADPGIRIEVTDKKIQIAAPLAQFLDVVATEMGNPAMLLTNAALRTRLLAAVDTVCAQMKTHTSKVM